MAPGGCERPDQAVALQDHWQLHLCVSCGCVGCVVPRTWHVGCCGCKAPAACSLGHEQQVALQKPCSALALPCPHMQVPQGPGPLQGHCPDQAERGGGQGGHGLNWPAVGGPRSRQQLWGCLIVMNEQICKQCGAGLRYVDCILLPCICRLVHAMCFTPACICKVMQCWTM